MRGIKYLTRKFSLDNVPGNQVLPKLFRLYYYLIKGIGVLPLRFDKNGTASYKWISWATLYTLGCFGLFLLDSFLLIPMYIYLLQRKDSPGVTHIAQVMFITCQYLGAVVTFLLIPLSTPRCARSWNKIQAITAAIVGMTSNQEFLSTYFETRWNVRMWLLSSFSFSIFCVYSFGDEFEIYMESGGETSWLVYWIYFCGFCCFPFILSFHILHSVILTTLFCVLKTCFIALGKHCDREKERSGGGENLSEKAICLYNELNEIVVELGESGGIYIVLEIIIMITCVTMNLFFLISQINEINGSVVYLAVIFPYVAWFHWICKSGHLFDMEASKCMRSVKQLDFHQSHNLNWSLLENPVSLAAAGYFSINMKLFTTVIGTITCYLIVMVQFKVGDCQNNNNPPLSSEESIKIKSNHNQT